MLVVELIIVPIIVRIFRLIIVQESKEFKRGCPGLVIGFGDFL